MHAKSPTFRAAKLKGFTVVIDGVSVQLLQVTMHRRQRHPLLVTVQRPDGETVLHSMQRQSKSEAGELRRATMSCDSVDIVTPRLISKRPTFLAGWTVYCRTGIAVGQCKLAP